MCRDTPIEGPLIPFQIAKCEHGGFVVMQNAYREERILFACTDIQKAFDFLKEKLDPPANTQSQGQG